MPYTLATLIQEFGPTLLAFGWIIVFWMVLLIAWKTYMLMKMIDYVSAIEWTYFQVTLPEDTEETPRSMQTLFDLIGGIHKNPDFNEEFFDGYLEAWASFELWCTQSAAKFIMVVPTAHRKLFEGIVYGQYPKAELKETEDYTLRYNWKDLRKKFEMWGSDMILTGDDIFPIKTYREFEAVFAEESRLVDPMQITIETLTNVEAGEEFWIQILVRPVSGKAIGDWEKRGEKKVQEISGQAKKAKPGFWENFRTFFSAVPGELLSIAFRGPLDLEKAKEEKVLRFFNPVDEAKMKGILQKVSSNGHKVKIRLIHIAPVGQMKKPNIGRGIGVFKQFAAVHMNSFAPDNASKTNGPNFIFRNKRRLFREKTVFQNYQWRDFFGRKSGQMMNSEELATIYHFPVKSTPAPTIQRAKAGRQNPPSNLPYA